MLPISEFSSSKEICAFCIGKSDKDPKIRHCGILYKLEDQEGKTFLIHLANPIQTRNDDERTYMLNHSNFYWKSFADCPLSLQRLLKSICVDIAKNHQHYPYSIFHDPSTIFEKKGTLKLGTNSNGLTCATFVTSIFYSATKKNLLDFDSWPDDRDTDLVWLNHIIDVYKNEIIKLKKSIDQLKEKLLTLKESSQEFITYQHKIIEYDKYIFKYEEVITDLSRGENECFVRFRPEEVVGAAEIPFKQLPLKFQKNELNDGAEIIGQNLLNYLNLER